MPRRSRSALREELNELQEKVAKIREQGEVLQGSWVATTRPGGTAGKPSQGKDYYQLRSRLPQFNGKKSRYLKASEVAKFEAACDRGRRLGKLEKRIDSLLQKLKSTDN